jgi:peptidoglycan/LPS O-acetylase OafA/YrhL
MLLDDHDHRSIIDFMRAVGILLVICFHVVLGITTLLEPGQVPAYIAEIPRVLNIWWQAMGSEIVFLFSGFLLSYLLMRELVKTGRIDVRDFYLRRLSRIIPLYAVALALYALVRDFHADEFILNLLFVSRLFDATTIIPVGWSLEVLVQSYILLPFVVLLFVGSRFPMILCSVAILGFLALRYLAFATDPISYTTPFYTLFLDEDPTETQQATYYLLHYRATPFLVGFLVAYLVIYRNAMLEALFRHAAVSLSVAAASLLLIAGSAFLPLHDPEGFIYKAAPDRFWLYFWTLQRFVFSVGVCGIALVTWYARSSLVRAFARLCGWRVWHTVSANIYSIYLFHPVFLIPGAAIGFRTVSREGILPVHFGEVLVTIVAVAALSTVFGALLTTKYLELPAQRWIRRRFSRRG